MDLIEILKKTKKRSEQVKIVRKPPSIASSDRPYSALDVSEKQETNQKIPSTYIKTDNKPTTNRQQTDNIFSNKPTTNRQQTENKNIILNETDNKPTTDSTTNRQQTDNKPATKTSFSMLVGLQRGCLLFIYQSCKANRSKVTESLSLEHMSQYLKTSAGAVKTTLQRLEEKGCLIRVSFKIGRGGWSIYELPESIFTEMLRQETDNKPTTNRQQIDNKPASQPATNLFSSSSKDINKTTTTGEAQNVQTLPPEWEEIDLSELNKRGIHFTLNHLTNLFPYLKNHSAFDFQESIDGYVYDIDNNFVDAKKGKLNMLIGIIRNHQLYISSHYESESRKKIKAMAELAKCRKEEELLAKSVLEEAEFTQWLEEYGKENIKKHLPTGLLVSFDHGDKAALEWVKSNIYASSLKK